MKIKRKKEKRSIANAAQRSLVRIIEQPAQRSLVRIIEQPERRSFSIDVNDLSGAVLKVKSTFEELNFHS